MEIFTEKLYGVNVDLSACIFLIKHKLSPLQKWIILQKGKSNKRMEQLEFRLQ